jgi:hypothetical protein
MPDSITITPAYGRDYKSAPAAVSDWENGKAFILETVNGRPVGQYCSVRDFPVGTEVNLRYARKTRKAVFQVKGA